MTATRALLRGFALNLLNDDEPDAFAQQLLEWIEERGYQLAEAAALPPEQGEPPVPDGGRWSRGGWHWLACWEQWSHDPERECVCDRLRRADNQDEAEAATRSTPAEPLDVPGTVERCPVCDRPEMVRLVNNWQQEGRVPIIGCGDPWHYDGLYDARLTTEGEKP